MLNKSVTAVAHNFLHVLSHFCVNLFNKRFAQFQPMLDYNASFFCVWMELTNDTHAHCGIKSYTSLNLMVHYVLCLNSVDISDLENLTKIGLGHTAVMRWEDATKLLDLEILVVERRPLDWPTTGASINASKEQ